MNVIVEQMDIGKTYAVYQISCEKIIFNHFLLAFGKQVAKRWFIRREIRITNLFEHKKVRSS